PEGIPKMDQNIQRLTHCSEEILQEPSRTARDLQLNVMEIKMVHCTLYCNLILARGRSHNTLGVTILTGCSSGTLPKILPMGTASLPSNLFISGGILFQSPSTTCSRYSGSILSSPTPQGDLTHHHHQHYRFTSMYFMSASVRVRQFPAILSFQISRFCKSSLFRPQLFISLV